MLQDNKWIQLGEQTEQTRDFFSIAASGKSRPFEFPDSLTHLAVSFEPDLTLYVIERQVSSYFDFLSATGGLNKGLRFLFKVVVGLLNYKMFSVYMVSKLFD